MSKFSRFIPPQEEDAIARQRRENAESLADADELAGPDKVRGLMACGIWLAMRWGWRPCSAGSYA